VEDSIDWRHFAAGSLFNSAEMKTATAQGVSLLLREHGTEFQHALPKLGITLRQTQFFLTLYCHVSARAPSESTMHPCFSH